MVWRQRNIGALPFCQQFFNQFLGSLKLNNSCSIVSINWTIWTFTIFQWSLILLRSRPKEVSFLGQFYLVYIGYILFQLTDILLATIANCIALISKILSMYLHYLLIQKLMLGTQNDICDFLKCPTEQPSYYFRPPDRVSDDILVMLLSLLTSGFLKSHTEYFTIQSFTAMTAKRRFQEYCYMVSNQ